MSKLPGTTGAKPDAKTPFRDEAEKAMYLEALKEVQLSISVMPYLGNKADLDMDVAVPVADLDDDFMIVGRPYAFEETRFGQISRADFIGMNPDFYYWQAADAMRTENKYTNETPVVLVHLNPKSYAICRKPKNGQDTATLTVILTNPVHGIH